jgi:hypothetical protein
MKAFPEPRGAENEWPPSTANTREREAIKALVVVAIHVIYEGLEDKEEEVV